MQVWQRIGNWWGTLNWFRRVLVVGTLVLALVIMLTQFNYECDWTGFGVCQFPNGLENGYRPEKTLWDWLGLLIVPAVLAGGAYFFNQSARRNELEIAEQRTQDARLQTYLDQMRELLLDRELRESAAGDPVRLVAQTQTLIALRRLDRERRMILMEFLRTLQLVGIDEARMVIDFRGVNLSDADLSFTLMHSINFYQANLYRANLQGSILQEADLERAILVGANLQKALLFEANLQKANLYGANLQGAYLLGVNFQGTYLREADLRGADLCGANLSEADLRGADLRGVDLRDTNLEGADFRKANFEGADLRGANLSEADLEGASLRRVNLRGAFVTQEQLETVASLEGATMHDGSKWS